MQILTSFLINLYRLWNKINKFHTICFGILIGILIGYCFEMDYLYDLDDFNHILFKNELKYNETFILNVYLQCIVLVDSNTKSNDYVSAIIDGYSNLCNETIFFTNSKKLVEEFGGIF